MALEDSKYVWVKVEPPCDSTAGLYTEHEFESAQVGRIVKEETKSESEEAPGASEHGAHLNHVIKIKIEEASSLSDLCSASTDVKLEAESESEEHVCDVSAAATRDGLYLKHEVKDELVVGPEEFQQPKVLAKRPASRQRAQTNSVLGRTCSVKLECMDVDLEQCLYRMGQNTYKFHLYLHNDAAKNKLKRRIQHGDRRQPKVEKTFNHRNKHTDEIIYQCEYCNFTSEFKKYIRVHKNIAHVGERRHKCDRCHYACYNKYSLQAHINAMHTNDRLYKCDQCSFTCSCKSRLRFHKRSHTGENPYKCKQCNYSCSRKNNFHGHKWVHSEKPYKCEQCNYATARKNELRTHVIAMHASDHVYKCDQCNYATVRKERFQAHKRLHSFASTSKDYPQVIKKVHTSEKSYTCDQCNYDSSREDLLEIHKNMIHAKKIAEQ